MTSDSGKRNLSLEERGRRPERRCWTSPETRASKRSGAGGREVGSGGHKPRDEGAHEGALERLHW